MPADCLRFLAPDTYSIENTKQETANMATQSLVVQTLVIADTIIHQDADGRYCINDLHQAAGGEKRHQPSNWLQNQQTIELIK